MEQDLKRVEPKIVKLFSLFPLLNGLESQRPGIRKRVWKFLCDEKYDIQSMVINGRPLAINLFYFGVGDHYPLKYIKEYQDEIERCKKTFIEATIEGSIKQQLQKDFNLIWFTYEDQIDNVEQFYIIPEY